MWLPGTRLSPWDRCAIVYHTLRPSLGTEASVVECVTLCAPRRPARMKLCSRSPASTASAPTQPAYLCTLPQRGRLRSLWISAVGQGLSQASGTLRVPTNQIATGLELRHLLSELYKATWRPGGTAAGRAKIISAIARAFEGVCRRDEIQRLRKPKTRSLC